MDLKQIEKDYNRGLLIIKQLFELSDKSLLKLIKEIVGDKYNDILNNNPTVTRIIENEIPIRIEITYYDILIIEWYGIDINSPEEGYTKRIRNFDEFFNLNISTHD